MNVNEMTESIEVNSDISEVDEPLTKPKRGRPKGVAKEPKPNGRKVRSEKQIEAWSKALQKKAEMRATIRLEKDEKMAEIYINKKNRESKQSNVEEDNISSSSDESIEISSRKTKSKHKKVIVPAPPKQKVKKVSRKVYYSSSSSSSSSSDSDSVSDDSTSESESSVEVVRHRTKTKTKKAQVIREQKSSPLSFFV
jgi:hypothetical protein